MEVGLGARRTLTLPNFELRETPDTPLVLLDFAASSASLLLRSYTVDESVFAEIGTVGRRVPNETVALVVLCANGCHKDRESCTVARTTESNRARAQRRRDGRWCVCGEGKLSSWDVHEGGRGGGDCLSCKGEFVRFILFITRGCRVGKR